jgi:TonB family protein
MQHAGRRSSEVRALSRAALQSAGLHLLAFALVVAWGWESPRQVALAIDLAPIRSAPDRDGRPSGGALEGAGAGRFEGGDASEEPPPALELAPPQAPTERSVGPAPRASTRARRHQVRPQAARRATPQALLGPRTAASRASSGARGMAERHAPTADQHPHKPLFVSETATREEVERFWKQAVLEQQLVLLKQKVAAGSGLEVDARAPTLPTDGKSGSPGEGTGSGAGADLRARLGGRVAAGSKVARAPALDDDPRGSCDVFSREGATTAIRLLVDTTGRVESAYVLRSSSDGQLDACALAFVRELRFRPGLDQQDHPLKVWLHAYVTAVDCRGGRCQQRLRTEP